jgi:hypothetical protein
VTYINIILQIRIKNIYITTCQLLKFLLIHICQLAKASSQNIECVRIWYSSVVVHKYSTKTFFFRHQLFIFFLVLINVINSIYYLNEYLVNFVKEILNKTNVFSLQIVDYVLALLCQICH